MQNEFGSMISEKNQISPAERPGRAFARRVQLER